VAIEVRFALHLKNLPVSLSVSFDLRLKKCGVDVFKLKVEQAILQREVSLLHVHASFFLKEKLRKFLLGLEESHACDAGLELTDDVDRVGEIKRNVPGIKKVFNQTNALSLLISVQSFEMNDHGIFHIQIWRQLVENFLCGVRFKVNVMVDGEVHSPIRLEIHAESKQWAS